MFDFDMRRACEENCLDFVSYTNADIDMTRPILQNVKGFHVVRDHRDMVVSAYFSHRYSHSNNLWSELVHYRGRLERLSKDDGLLFTMEYLGCLAVDGIELDIFGHMNN